MVLHMFVDITCQVSAGFRRTLMKRLKRQQGLTDFQEEHRSSQLTHTRTTAPQGLFLQGPTKVTMLGNSDPLTMRELLYH